MSDIKSQITTSFKLSGLTVRLEAAKYLVGLMTPLEEEERQEWIDRIIDRLGSSNLKSSVIDKEILSSAVRQCSNQAAGNVDVKTLNTINVFDAPRLCFNAERKKYLSDNFSKRSPPLLLATADCKSRLFLDRFGVLSVRVPRANLPDIQVQSPPPEDSQARPVQWAERQPGNQLPAEDCGVSAGDNQQAGRHHRAGDDHADVPRHLSPWSDYQDH